MTTNELLDRLISVGLGVAEALAETNRIMAEAKLIPSGQSITYSLRRTGKPVLTIAKR